MRMGDGAASTGDVLSLFELGLLEWDLGGLRKDDVNVRDKMNVMSFVRLTSPMVQAALQSQHKPHTAAVCSIFLHTHLLCLCL